MLIIDASSMIYGWDNYPIEQFPRVWEWTETQIKERELQIPGVAFEEVFHKLPECCAWLKERACEIIAETNAILTAALQIKNLLGIHNDDYHVKGVDENDLLVIATAKVAGASLLSDEKRQLKLPDIRKKMKIPAVCALPEVNVVCKSFLEYLKGSRAVF